MGPIGNTQTGAGHHLAAITCCAMCAFWSAIYRLLDIIITLTLFPLMISILRCSVIHLCVHQCMIRQRAEVITLEAPLLSDEICLIHGSSINQENFVVYNIALTLTNFVVCVGGAVWKASLCRRDKPSHMTTNRNYRGNMVYIRVILIWSVIRGSSWSSLTKTGPGLK